jgi:hypothetical protein
MMGLKVGLLAVGLLAMVATPTMAQHPGGLGDPLQVAASGILLPYYNAAAGEVSFLEVSSPATDIPDGHLIFFDAACVRGLSFPLPLTRDDLELFDTRGGGAGINGLVAFASSIDGNNFIPIRGLYNPNPLQPFVFDTTFNTGVHSRMYSIDVNTGKTRVYNPIILTAAEDINNATLAWSPLRSAHTFFSLPQDVNIVTTLHLVCPKQTIQGTTLTSGVFPVQPAQGNFPDIGYPNASTSSEFLTGYGNAALAGRIYDLDEHFIIDFISNCDCNQIKTLGQLSPAGYLNHALVPFNSGGGSYTEIHSAGPNDTANDFAWTGWRIMEISGTAFHAFHRLSNASRQATQQNPTNSSQPILSPGRR